LPVSQARRWRLAPGVLLLGVVLLMRAPALIYPHPIDDEAVYSVVAEEMLHGGLMYRDAVERKPPLLFWTYEAIFDATTPSNWTALHITATVWLAATMAGLLVLGLVIDSPEAGVVAALLYGIYQAWASWRNLAFNGEMLMNLPMVWAWVLACAGARARSTLAFAGAGMLMAVAGLLKQPAAIAVVPLLVYPWLPEFRRQYSATLRDAARLTLSLAAGSLAVVVLVAAILWREHVLGDAVYWSIGDHDVPHVFWGRAAMFSAAFFAAVLPLVYGSLVAMRSVAVWTGKLAERTAIGGWLVVSAIGVAASGRFYPHYYIQMLPPMAVLSGVAYTALTNRRVARPRWCPSPAALALVTTVTALGFAAVETWGLERQPQSSAAGDYLRGHTTADDRIFVWGQSPGVYLDADRRPASRFITTFPLTGYIFAGPLPGVDTRSRILAGAWDTLQRDLSAHPPAFIVDTADHVGAEYPTSDFPILAALLRSDYDRAVVLADATVYQRRVRPPSDAVDRLR